MVKEIANIVRHLDAIAQSQPYLKAVVEPAGRDRFGRIRYIHYTYQQLSQQCDRIAHGLKRQGVERGMRVVLMAKPSLDFFALTFALLKMGSVPVMIDPGMGLKNLGQCLAEAEPEAFIGIRKAQLARKIMGWGKKTIRLVVTVPKDWSQESHEPYPIAETTDLDMAAILFTSGSTGVPKGVIYTHGIFENQFRMLQTTYQIQPGEVDVPTFPLFALFAPGLGMTSIIPTMDFTRPATVHPDRIRECIEDFGATSMFGSPALLKRVGEYGRARGWRFPSIKRVITAGAPVSWKILETFSSLLSEDALIVTPYGATESLPVCNINHREVLQETRHRTDQGQGVCVGHPVAGVQVQIVQITDDPILTWSDELVVPQGEIGEIVVSSPVVTSGYFHRPQSTELAKIHDPRTGLLRHRMGDLGYLDNQGRVWFCGRKSHRVIGSNQVFFTISCEGVFNAHPDVARTALVGVKRQGEIVPALCVELAASANGKPWETLKAELKQMGERYSHTKPIQLFYRHPSFPVDVRHNAKIFREKLAVWADQQRD